MGLHGSGDGSIVDRSWRRFLRKRRPSTSTSYDRRARGRVQWPKQWCCANRGLLIVGLSCRPSLS